MIQIESTITSENKTLNSIEIVDYCLEGDVEFLNEPTQRFTVTFDYMSPGITCKFILQNPQPMMINFTQNTITTEGSLAKVDDIPRMGEFHVFALIILF